MGEVVDLVSRPMYGLGQVDHLLGLRPGTARRWIDGYSRGGKHYPPVVREQTSGAEIVTWGEFVETRLLSEYRHAGVPLIRMRPVVDELRETLQTDYPLASARTWLHVHGRELVRQAQEQVGLDRSLALVEELRTGQQAVAWTPAAANFLRSVEWAAGNGQQPERLRPVADVKEVVIDPFRGFGEPVVRFNRENGDSEMRSVRTEVIAELVRAGDPPDMIAELYELPREAVDAAVRYELLRATA